MLVEILAHPRITWITRVSAPAAIPSCASMAACRKSWILVRPAASLKYPQCSPATPAKGSNTARSVDWMEVCRKRAAIVWFYCCRESENITPTSHSRARFLVPESFAKSSATLDPACDILSKVQSQSLSAKRYTLQVVSVCDWPYSAACHFFHELQIFSPGSPKISKLTMLKNSAAFLAFHLPQ